MGKKKKIKGKKGRRKKHKKRFKLSKQGREIEAKVKQMVWKDILEHSRIPPQQMDEFLAGLINESVKHEGEPGFVGRYLSIYSFE